MTQQQVAEQLHVTRQALSNWETGKTTPDIQSLLQLSELYCLSIDKLLDNDIAELIDERAAKEWRFYTYIIGGLVALMVLFMGLTLALENRLWLIGVAGSWVVLMFFCLRLERIKRNKQIYSYQKVTRILKLNQKKGEVRKKETRKRG